MKRSARWNERLLKYEDRKLGERESMRYDGSERDCDGVMVGGVEYGFLCREDLLDPLVFTSSKNWIIVTNRPPRFSCPNSGGCNPRLTPFLADVTQASDQWWLM